MSEQNKQTGGAARDRLRRSQQVLKTQNDTPAKTAVLQESLPAQPSVQPVAKESDREEAERPDPTRYGDWERNGRCIDF